LVVLAVPSVKVPVLTSVRVKVVVLWTRWRVILPTPPTVKFGLSRISALT
jgi:hypothetical protein